MFGKNDVTIIIKMWNNPGDYHVDITCWRSHVLLYEISFQLLLMLHQPVSIIGMSIFKTLLIEKSTCRKYHQNKLISTIIILIMIEIDLKIVYLKFINLITYKYFDLY